MIRTTRKKVFRPLQSRLRALGHRLGLAEADGSERDLSKEKSEHAKLLNKFYWGKEGK